MSIPLRTRYTNTNLKLFTYEGAGGEMGGGGPEVGLFTSRIRGHISSVQ